MPRLGIPRRRLAALAGRDAGQRHQLPPAKRRPRGGELLADGAVVFFGVQRTVLARGIAEQQIKDPPRWMAELAVPLDGGAGAGLVVLANRALGLAGQRLELAGPELR